MAVKNLLGFISLYIYVQWIVCPVHILIALLTGKSNAYACTKNVCNIMNIKFLHTKNSKNLHPEAMYLCNHRSWGDFFMDQVICGGGAFLSRYLVILGCPVSSLYAWIANSTWFFNRKKGLNRDALASYLETCWLTRPGKGLIVFPEGTRNQKKEPLRLKTGVLKMAYDYKRPVQSVVTTGKELVANEKTLHCERGVVCVSSISPAIKPQDYDTFESFVAAVRKQFEDTWADAYAQEPEAAIEYIPPLGLPTPAYESLKHPLRVWSVRLIVMLILAYVYMKTK